MPRKSDKFRLSHLRSVADIINAMRRTIRAMSDETINVQKGTALITGLKELRAAVEGTQVIGDLQAQMAALAQMATDKQRSGSTAARQHEPPPAPDRYATTRVQ